MFLDMPEAFHWVGMAKRAGASVYWGLSDSQHALENIFVGLPVDSTVAWSFQQVLLNGMKDVYEDIGWQFIAFKIGGIGSMRYLRSVNSIRSEYLLAWEDMHAGIIALPNCSPLLIPQNGLIDLAGEQIALLEQRDVLGPSFDAMRTLNGTGFPHSFFIGLFSVNSVPGGPGFSQFMPGGDIANFADRWEWIADPTGGMLTRWSSLGHPARASSVTPLIEVLAEPLTIFPIK